MHRLLAVKVPLCGLNKYSGKRYRRFVTKDEAKIWLMEDLITEGFTRVRTCGLMNKFCVLSLDEFETSTTSGFRSHLFWNGKTNQSSILANVFAFKIALENTQGDLLIYTHQFQSIDLLRFTGDRLVREVDELMVGRNVEFELLDDEQGICTYLADMAE